jgi:hypothetical protein
MPMSFSLSCLSRTMMFAGFTSRWI